MASLLLIKGGDMKLNYDIAIAISVAGSRKAAVWNPQKMMWSDFITKVSRPFVSPETLQEYKALPTG